MVKCSFPYNGSKTLAAPVVWRVFGDVKSYIEPFFGSGAVLLNRPKPRCSVKEIINDKSGFISNFWRSVKNDPEAVAYYADLPVNENNYHAIHIKLVTLSSDLDRKLEGSFSFYDPEIAGYWLWGRCISISTIWCSVKGPWTIVDGKLVKEKSHHVSSRLNPSIRRGIVSLRNPYGGVYSSYSKLGKDRYSHILQSIMLLSNRLEDVLVLSGDWLRCVTDSVLSIADPTAIFLDPPYLGSTTVSGYSCLLDEPSPFLASEVESWCISNTDNKKIKIALCGYEGDYLSLPPSWYKFRWHQPYGYNRENKIKTEEGRECIFFSPSCNLSSSSSLSLSSSLSDQEVPLSSPPFDTVDEGCTNDYIDNLLSSPFHS